MSHFPERSRRSVLPIDTVIRIPHLRPGLTIEITVDEQTDASWDALAQHTSLAAVSFARRLKGERVAFVPSGDLEAVSGRHRIEVPVFTVHDERRPAEPF